VDWIRKNILLKKQPKPVLSLEIKLPLRNSPDFGLITLFVDTSNGYLFAFRGQDKTYILRDDRQDEYQALLRQTGNGTAAILHGVASDHRSLGTFLPKKGSAGMRGRSYAIAHLQGGARLAEFSADRGPVTESDVAGAMSLLVCMLAECSRWPRIEREFERIYFGENVQADEIFKVYDKAKRIRRLAEVFPNYLIADRVEKLVKRANEVNELLTALRTTLGGSPLENQALIGLCLGAPKGSVGGDKNSAERIRTICTELKADAKTMAEILSLCSNEQATRAAQSGVIG
jgi:hypothetical protein